VVGQWTDIIVLVFFAEQVDFFWGIKVDFAFQSDRQLSFGAPIEEIQVVVVFELRGIEDFLRLWLDVFFYLGFGQEVYFSSHELSDFAHERVGAVEGRLLHRFVDHLWLKDVTWNKHLVRGFVLRFHLLDWTVVILEAWQVLIFDRDEPVGGEFGFGLGF
jgi:hypothetical protein